MTFPFDYQLVTARCRLRAPTQADIPHVFSATRYAGFNDGMLWDAPASEADLLAPYEQSRRAWSDDDSFTFTIETKDQAAFLGRIGIRSTVNPKLWSIGFWLHPTQQGQGFMTEAASAIIDFGFEQLGADAIEACYATWNIRSRRVLERVGMIEVEYLPYGYQKRGQWIPEYRMRREKRSNQSSEPTPTAGASTAERPRAPAGRMTRT